eukprot:gene16835-23052_t
MVLKIVVVGAGFSGILFARFIEENCHDGDCEITVFESALNESDNQHWTQPVSGAALNINANGISYIQKYDTDFLRELKAASFPRKQIKCISTGKNIPDYINIPDIVEEGLASCYGAIIRWHDANQIARKLYGVEKIKWGVRVIGYSHNKFDGKIKIMTSDDAQYDDFDFLVAADGRYSAVRQVDELSNMPATFEDIFNFRLLVPISEECDKLCGDLELLYNIPDVKNCESFLTPSQIQHFSSTKAFKGLARAGIARCPPSSLCPLGSVYIFGNFSIDYDNSGNVLEYVKSASFLKSLFIPRGGVENLTAKAAWLIKTLETYSNELHWARFQHIEAKFSPNSSHAMKVSDDYFSCDNSNSNSTNADVIPVMYLGDAAHSFPPSLGQGATSAIEDAYIAAEILISKMKIFKSFLSSELSKDQTVDDSFARVKMIRDVIQSVSDARLSRIEMIKDLSITAGYHITPAIQSNIKTMTIEDIAAYQHENLQMEIDNWTRD